MLWNDAIIILEYKFCKGRDFVFFFFHFSFFTSHTYLCVIVHCGAASGPGSSLRVFSILIIYLCFSPDRWFSSSQPTILDFPFGGRAEARNSDHGGITLLTGLSLSLSLPWFVVSLPSFCSSRSSWLLHMASADDWPDFS